jgi:two-component system response regulator LytT
MLRFAICDDEPYMLDTLSDLLSRSLDSLPYHITRFHSGTELLANSTPFDLIFLDIQMEAPDGMETARRMRQQGRRSLLVFVTVLKEYVFDAFAVDAFDYLLKPLDPQRFQEILARGLKALDQQCAQELLVQRGACVQVLPSKEIVYFEVLGRKVYVHQADGTVLDYYDKLEDLEARFHGHFFRCHRSYLVNLDYVRGCSGGQVSLSTGEAVPLSRLRRQDLTQALLRHMRERGR